MLFLCLFYIRWNLSEYTFYIKNLFKKLNEHSKDLQAKQEEIIKKHNLLLEQYEELEYLKVNMNDYLGRDKT